MSLPLRPLTVCLSACMLLAFILSCGGGSESRGSASVNGPLGLVPDGYQRVTQWDVVGLLAS